MRYDSDVVLVIKGTVDIPDDIEMLKLANLNEVRDGWSYYQWSWVDWYWLGKEVDAWLNKLDMYEYLLLRDGEETSDYEVRGCYHDSGCNIGIIIPPVPMTITDTTTCSYAEQGKQVIELLISVALIAATIFIAYQLV